MIGIQNIIVRQTEAALRYENGRYAETLEPGQYTLVSWPWRRHDVTRVDLRRTEMLISGQEMLTADGLSVRLNVAAQYRVVDPVAALHSVRDYVTALYTTLQLLLREEVQARPLDTLLAERRALSGALLERGGPEAAEIGLELVHAGVKDIILPGDVKRMLSQEIEAQRAGRAALVAAREEVAATRARANTAQLLQNNPMLVRLREIEALAQVAGGMGNTVVVAVPTEVMSALGAGRRPGGEGVG